MAFTAKRFCPCANIKLICKHSAYNAIICFQSVGLNAAALHFVGFLGALIDNIRLAEGRNRFGYDLANISYPVLGIIRRLYRLGEAVKNIAHLGAGHGGIMFDKDEVVFGLCKRFGLNEQLLIQLFTGTQTYLFYLDIEVRLES